MRMMFSKFIVLVLRDFAVLCFLVFLPIQGVLGQNAEDLRWLSTSELQVSGRLPQDCNGELGRLPGYLKDQVRLPLWNLGQNAAGVYLEFLTDATTFYIQYHVLGELALPHMPATGVSGMDLYAEEESGKWEWLRGQYQFGEEIQYVYSGIKPAVEPTLRTYRLYLPLYNTVRNLKIGIPQDANFQQSKSAAELHPILIYGTSIVQGACASRPGMAWPSILGRIMAAPVVNLGFSGNGRLEPEIIEFMTLQQASAYVLDCMPNFTSGNGLGPAQAEQRILMAVDQIRAIHPQTPILIMDHGGYSDGVMQPGREEVVTKLNEAVSRAFLKMEHRGLTGVYRLTREDIGLTPDGFVDGTHPNDFGMLVYAQGVARKLKDIGVEK